MAEEFENDPAPAASPLPGTFDSELPFAVPNWADLKGAGSALPAGVIDAEAAAALTSDEVVNQIRLAKAESAKLRLPLEDGWRLYEAAYFSQYSHTDREAWQSRLEIPEVTNKIRAAVAQMSGSLLEADDWFSVFERGTVTDSRVVELVEKWLSLEVKNTDFINHYSKLFEDAFLYGTGWLAFGFEEYIDYRPRTVTKPLYADPQAAMQANMQGLPLSETVVETDAIARGRNVLRNVSPWDVYPDPFATTFSDAKYVLEETMVDEYDIYAGRTAGMYDFEGELGSPMGMSDAALSSATPSAWARRQSPTTKRKRHLVTTYYGCLYDAAGEMVCKNFKVVLADYKTVLSIGPNPLWNGEFPYICSTPLDHREMLWGRSLVETDALIQAEMTGLTNLMLDDIRYSVLAAFVMDPSKSEEPIDIDSVEPGRVYRGRDGMIQKLSFTSQSSAAWPILQHLQQIGDTSTGITEFVQGRPTSRGRPSATEINQKSSAGQAYLSTIARGSERNDVERGLNLLYQHIIQFGSDDGDPDMIAILDGFGGTQLLNDPVARFEILDQPVGIEVGGISKVLSRESTNVKLQEVLAAGEGMGLPPNQKASILYAMISNLGLDPAQLGWPATEEEYQAMLQQMQVSTDAQNENGGPPAGTGGATAANPDARTPEGVPPMMPNPDSEQGPV